MEQQGGDHAPGHAGDHVPHLRPAHQVHEGGGPAAVAHGHVSRVTCHVSPRHAATARHAQLSLATGGQGTHCLRCAIYVYWTDPKLLKMSH